MAKNYEESLIFLEDFVTKNVTPGSRNEATTRFHLIDSLFFDSLGWEKTDCLVEDIYEGKYTDYSFGRLQKRLVVEAKKEGNYFDFPEGFKDRVCNIKTLFKNNQNIEDAVRQALGYCQERGIPVGVVTNGTQLIGFLGSRNDGVPPLDGKAVVFSSLQDIKDNFKEFWNNFSYSGIENYHIFSTLKSVTQVPPDKLSTHIADYPGFKNRNELQTELQVMGGVFLEDISKEPSLEENFLKECYCPSGALSQYAFVSKQILETRYSSLFKKEIETNTTDVSTKKGTSPQITEDIIAAGLSRRPIILLGEVGSGKSMFIRHFIKVEAPELLEKALVIYIDFGKEPALPSELTQFVLQSCKKQLNKTYNINIEDLNFITGVYGLELENFRHKGIYSQLRSSNPAAFQQKEIEFLENKIKDAQEHLKSCLEHISKGQKRQIVVFLDNIDQRPIDFQDDVFLIGNGLAEAWPATVFVSLRPDTFFYSKRKGSITGYQPRVFTLSPPRVDQVILKRLEFAMKSLASSGHLESLPGGVSLHSKKLLKYFEIIHESFTTNKDLIEFVDNVSGGNIRQAISFFTAFVGSGHVDTAKILEIYEREGRYLIPIHEFFRAVIYGDNEYYTPSSSPLTNLFDISTPDGKEHFLLPIILMHIERTGSLATEQGYVLTSKVYEYCQGFGYTPYQIKFALQRGLVSKLIESNPRFISEEEQIVHYRITTVGAYTVKRMINFFSYVDAVVVDVPITNQFFSAKIVDNISLESRLERVKILCEYLDQEWKKVSGNSLPFDWAITSHKLKGEVDRIFKFYSTKNS